MQNNSVIDKFMGDTFFLSNFYKASVNYLGFTFLSSEAAFQAAKCPRRMAEFTTLPPNEAKRLGRSVKMRPDWDTVKDGIMYDVCLAKFTQHPDLAEKLLATGDAMLIEGNTWGDTYWGVCNGVGENHLGKTLMQIREELREERGSTSKKEDVVKSFKGVMERYRSGAFGDKSMSLYNVFLRAGAIDTLEAAIGFGEDTLIECGLSEKMAKLIAGNTVFERDGEDHV